MKRVLALVVAVALVAGAYAVRTRVIDKDDTTTVESGGGQPTSKTPVVACAPELTGVCEALRGADGVRVARRAHRPR